MRFNARALDVEVDGCIARERDVSVCGHILIQGMVPSTSRLFDLVPLVMFDICWKIRSNI